MKKFLSYESSDTYFSMEIKIHVISLHMVFLFLWYSYHINQRRPSWDFEPLDWNPTARSASFSSIFFHLVASLFPSPPLIEPSATTTYSRLAHTPRLSAASHRLCIASTATTITLSFVLLWRRWPALASHRQIPSFPSTASPTPGRCRLAGDALWRGVFVSSSGLCSSLSIKSTVEKKTNAEFYFDQR